MTAALPRPPHFPDGSVSRRSRYRHRIPQLSDEEYYKQLDKQYGVCWLCGRAPKKRRLAGDHNHRTGKRRALLCYCCNRFVIGAIERFQIDPKKIVEYFDTFDS